jgi:hypothetical protein
MYQNNFQFEVLVHGRPIREYPHRGETFVEAVLGREFTLKVTDYTNRNAAVVLTVDGLSVTSGKLGRRDDKAYIVHAQNSIEIPGWTLSFGREGEVAHFYFGRLPEAYATRMGRPNNIGVLGCSIFLEKEYEPVLEVANEMYAKSAVRYSFGSAGAGFGRRQDFATHSVHFERESYVHTEMQIRYDFAEQLRRRGIVLAGPHPDERWFTDEPNAFPGDDGCIPPSNWRG